MDDSDAVTGLLVGVKIPGKKKLGGRGGYPAVDRD
jgi:hypothetical protein